MGHKSSTETASGLIKVRLQGSLGLIHTPSLGSMNSTVSNTTDNMDMYISMLKHPPAIIALFVVGYVITFMVTMIGNSIVCYVILKIPHMRNVTNYFVFNLAVSDMLSAIFCMPFTLVDHIIRGWPFGEVMCKVFPAMQIITVAASLFTLVAIAFDSASFSFREE
ncbi:Neuropeptide FF receptor 2 [Branchiostoma belcheri]|nr:Neuropeptide FF receptor 2 [Branchiostoma belcheri]